MTKTFRKTIGALCGGTLSLAVGAAALAAELPTLHAEPSPSAETPGAAAKGFDIPGSGFHVTYGGYVEGAVTMTLPKNAATGSSRFRKPTP
jgi:hypothetical protein